MILRAQPVPQGKVGTPANGGVPLGSRVVSQAALLRDDLREVSFAWGVGEGEMKERTATRRNPEAAFGSFRLLVADRFGWLRQSFGFIGHGSSFLDPGMWIVLRNTTTQLEVLFEYEVGVWTTIRRLACLERDRRPVEGYGLQEVLVLRAPDRESSAPVRDFDEVLVRQTLDEQARGVRERQSRRTEVRTAGGGWE